MITHPLLSEQMKGYLLKEFVQLEPRELQAAVVEYYKFMQLAIHIGLTQFLPVSVMIDEIWHCHILQTREYFRLCDAIKHGSYLHHESIPYAEYQRANTASDMKIEDLRWLGLYSLAFGDFPEVGARHWIIPNFLISENKWSIRKVNKMCRTIALTCNREILGELAN